MTLFSIIRGFGGELKQFLSSQQLQRIETLLEAAQFYDTDALTKGHARTALDSMAQSMNDFRNLVI